MYLRRTSMAGILIILVLSIAAQILPLAGETEAISRTSFHPLAGRHRIELGIGLMSRIYSTTKVWDDHTTTRSEANGLLGSISYSYWLEDHVSVHVSTGVMDVDAYATEYGSDTHVEASTVSPLLFGVKYQLSRYPIGAAMRPYVSAAVGPYFGVNSNIRSKSGSEVRSYTEAVLGTRIGAGVDLVLSRHFTLGVGAGYHFVSDYSEPIGAKKDYSSPDFSFSFGVVFGRGR